MGFQNAPPHGRGVNFGEGREWQTVAMAGHQPTNTLPQCSMFNVTDSDSVGDDSSTARIATCNAEKLEWQKRDQEQKIL